MFESLLKYARSLGPSVRTFCIALALIVCGWLSIRLATNVDLNAASVPDRQVNTWLAFVALVLGVLLVLCGAYVFLRAPDPVGVRPAADAERLSRMELNLEALTRELSSRNAFIQTLAVLAAPNKERAFIGYLDGIVGMCRERNPPSKSYEFWVKIYVLDSSGALRTLARSSNAPAGVSEHHLGLNQGAAGTFLEAFRTRPRLQPEIYHGPAIRRGLDPAAMAEIDRRGVQTVMCAAITAHVARPGTNGRSHLDPVLRDGRKRLYGVLCFVSTLDAESTSLRDVNKQRACQFAANFAGAVLYKDSLTPGSSEAPLEIMV